MSDHSPHTLSHVLSDGTHEGNNYNSSSSSQGQAVCRVLSGDQTLEHPVITDETVWLGGRAQIEPVLPAPLPYGLPSL